MIITVFFIAHILGDFYFQTDKLSKEKESSVKYLLFHGLVYLLTMTGLSLAVFRFSRRLFLTAVLIAVSHLAVDFIKCLLSKKSVNERFLFFTDQLLHIACILTAAFFLLRNTGAPVYDYLTKISTFGDGIDVLWLFKLILLILLMCKPANVIFRKYLLRYKPDPDPEGSPSPKDWQRQEDKALRVGGLIGSLERILIVIFMIMNQFAAIGLVMTAKSLARYSEIANNKEFSEYYLIGTLSSMIYSIVLSLLMFF